MGPITVILAPDSTRVRILATSPNGEILRASLGHPTDMHPRAAVTFLESLALWHSQRLSVVLAAEDQDDGYAMGLCNALGFGEHNLHFELAIAMRDRPRRQRHYLGGIGSFRDLHALSTSKELF